MNRIALLLAVTLILAGRSASAELVVFTCEPEWAELIREIAGDDMNTFSATTARQDPHRLQARPSLIARVRQADLLVCTGADLEVGWLPLLLRRAGNPRLLPGQPGHFIASDHVRKLEIPSRIDRAGGDIHPQGNPHVHLDPRNLLRIADPLARRLAQLDPARADHNLAGLARFKETFRAHIKTWREKAMPLKSMVIITHHRSYSYLVNWLGIEVLDTIEPKPGIPPSSSHLTKLLRLMEARAPKYILVTPYSNPKPASWLSERTDVAVIELPYSVGREHTAATLFDLFDTSINLLLGPS